MAGQAYDEEKLPWLEPYREPEVAVVRRGKAKVAALKAAAATSVVEPAAPPTWSLPAVPAPSKKAVPLAAWLATGVVIVGLAAGGGYWIGYRDAPAGIAPAPTVTIPVAKVEPIPMPEVIATEDEVAQPQAQAPGASQGRKGPQARRVVHRRPVHVSRLSVPPSRPAAAPPLPKAMAVTLIPRGSAGPPGTVVDLGRYLSPRMADSAFRTTAGRYPYLGSLKRVVVPLPASYGQPRLYALQLGANSSREAKILCNNLVRIGRPCDVQ